MVTLCFWLLATAAPTKGSSALALYRAGRYAEACPLFRAVAETKKTDGAAWSDLVLCLFKLHGTEGTLPAVLAALRYGDERVRKQVTFNLAKREHVALQTPALLEASGGDRDPSSSWSCSVHRWPELGCTTAAWWCSARESFWPAGRDPAWGGELLTETLGLSFDGGFPAIPARLPVTGLSEAVAETRTVARTLDGGSPFGSLVVVRRSVSYYFTPDERPRPADEDCELVAIDPCARRAFVYCPGAGGARALEYEIPR